MIGNRPVPAKAAYIGCWVELSRIGVLSDHSKTFEPLNGYRYEYLIAPQTGFQYCFLAIAFYYSYTRTHALA